MELVSVIVPIYRVEQYLKRCVSSIQQQTYENLEIILVDDGSPDCCGEICDSLQVDDQRITVIHTKNGGLSYARNLGIEASHGDYLMFVDGDDWIDVDMIEILLELCVDYQAEISECQYREVFSETRSKKQNNSEKITRMKKMEALEGMLDWVYFKPMAWGKLYKRDVIGDIRFPLNKLNEDEFTTYKYIYNANNLVHIDLVKYNYNRFNENSITSKFLVNNLDACEAFLERREFFKFNHIDKLEEKMNNAYCIVVLDTLYECYKNKIFGERVDSLLEQVRKDIKYLADKPIDVYFVNELKIVAESLDDYGRHREKMEKQNDKQTKNICENRSYEEVLLENKQLAERIDALLNSRTWRLSENVKRIFKIKYVKNIVKRCLHSKEKDIDGMNQKKSSSKVETIKYNYDHLLYESEFKFFKYKKYRDMLYPLDLSKIKLSYVEDMVSVVLPVYNGEDYLVLSIESVLKQSYKNFELIIIDDGSTDSTPQIVDEYAIRDARVKVIHQSNIRLPKTLSKGFRIAQGEFYTWTSADNIMHEDFLERFVGDLKNNPTVGMVWGNMRLIDENGEAISDNQWYANSEYPEEVMFPRSVLQLNINPNNYIGAAFMYRAICAHIAMDYSAFKFCTEDYDYWMKINEVCVLRHTSFEDTLYSYRFHSNSLTSKDKELKITENRYKLMLLDDFRRDFYLKPSVWVFYGGDTSWSDELKLLIEKAGHLVVDQKDALELDGNLYEGVIFVSIDKECMESKDCEIPNSYKIFVSNEEKSIRENWDCCITFDSKETNTQTCLEGFKGWYKIGDVRTLFSFIDAKSKTKFLYELESKMDYKMKREGSLSVILLYSGNMEVLHQCLLSIEGQCTDLEVVLVVQRDFFHHDWMQFEKKHPRVKIVKSIFGNKVTQTNIGIWESKGEIIIFGEDDYIFGDNYFNELKKIMENEQVKVVCGSVKNGSDNCKTNNELFGEHRFYSDGLIVELKKTYANNVSVKREELLTIGGLYHLSPELEDVCIEAPLYGLIKIIQSHNQKSVFKSKHCTVYRKNHELTIDSKCWKKSQLLGFYGLEERLIEPFNTYPEVIEKNHEKLDEPLLEYFVQKVRADFDDRAQVDWIREWYSSLKSPLISIIVPIYNAEKELQRCVDSILTQTFVNLEVILVNDGSKDSSGKMCDEYSKRDQRVKVIHKVNGGLSETRNVGIDVALGWYIMFVDSDDWIDEDMCEVLYGVAVEENAEIVECSYRNVYPSHIEEETSNTGEVITGDSVFALKGQLEWKFFKSVAWNKLYSRNIFADGKRYPKGRYHEDEFFTHQAFYAAKKLAYIDISKYNYWHGRKDSITGTITENILDSCYALRSRVDFVMDNNIAEVETGVKNMYCWMLFDRIYKCYKSNVRGSKLEKLLYDVGEDRKNVLSWDISEEYKAEYEILLKSYKAFCKHREELELYEKMH